MMKRILVGLAGTTCTPAAVRHAIALAQLHDAEVAGVTVLDFSRVRGVAAGMAKAPNLEIVLAERMAAARSQNQQAIHDFTAACQAANIKHQVVEETGDPFTRLVELARYHDLMLFGLRGVQNDGSFATDPESLMIRLVAAGVRPLVAVPENSRDVQRAVVAYNGSMESAKAMKRFVQMRLWPNAELKIVTFQPTDAQARELLEPAEEYCRKHGYTVSSQSIPGSPTFLLQAAKMWDAEIIVMGNSARSVLLRKVLGDTLLATLRETTIPLYLAQ
jgi:nucleotide-binding universal stress UspA family protein